jgi:PAS domain S-box-containing protein
VWYEDMKRSIAAWTSRFSSKVIILGGFGLVIILGLIPALFSQWAVEHSSRVMNRFIDVDQKIADLSLKSIVIMTRVRRNEKDFLLSYRDFGFNEARSRYITTLLARIVDIRENMENIRKLVDEPEIVRMTREIDKSLNQYEASIVDVVEMYGKIGTDKSGLEGSFRATADRMENILRRQNNSALLVSLLALRNSEKNFIIQNLDINFSRIQQNVDQLRASIDTSTLAPDQKKELILALNNYINLVRQYANITNDIEIVREAYLKSLQSVEPTLERLYSISIGNTYRTRAGIRYSENKIIITMLVSFLLAVMLSFTISIFVFKILRESEERLQLSEKKYRTLFETAPDSIMITDMNRAVMMVNRQSLMLLGYDKAEDMVGKNSTDFITPEDRQLASDQEGKLSPGRPMEGIEYRMLTRDGRRIAVEGNASMILDAGGKPEYIITVARDVTERILAEEKIRFLASIIENLPDAVCAVNDKGETVAWNKGAEKILGYKAEEIIGKRISVIIPEDRAQKELDHCFALLNTEGFFSGYESVRIARDGRLIPVELTGVTIVDKEQKSRYYASITTDISERKKMEQERLKSHMLESIGLLAGGIAHDFNNLLTIMLSNIYIVKTLIPKQEKAAERLTHMEEICVLASELSRRLITFSTGGDPIKRILTLSGLLTDTVSLMLKDSNVNLLIDLPDDLHAVAIDEGQMKQVISNLVYNAREAMQGGGSLTIRGENLNVTSDDSLPIRKGDYVKISFTDTGVGIPAENLAKIFDPYYSTKDTYSQKGLGLGLAVCYSVIKKHDGLITVESEVGKGTTFHIFIPAV